MTGWDTTYLCMLQKIVRVQFKEKDAIVGFFFDAASRYKMESVLRSINDWYGSVVLRGQNLTAFYHSQFFTLFQEIDLSENPLGNDVIAKLNSFLSCKV